MKFSLRFLPRAGAVLFIFVSLAGCNRSTPPDAGNAATPVKKEIEMTPTQKLGVEVVTSISQDKALQGARVSVGTSKDTVTLDGSVLSQAQKQAAEKVAKVKAPGYKVINRLKVDPKLGTPAPNTKPTPAKP